MLFLGSVTSVAGSSIVGELGGAFVPASWKTGKGACSSSRCGPAACGPVRPAENPAVGELVCLSGVWLGFHEFSVPVSPLRG